MATEIGTWKPERAGDPVPSGGWVESGRQVRSRRAQCSRDAVAPRCVAMTRPAAPLAFLLELLAAVHCQVIVQVPRVIGGYAPAPHAIKYIVSIQSTSGQHFCGGTIINKYWVLTAAHCNVGADYMLIIAGDYSLSMYEGTEQFYRPHFLVPHPDYDEATKNADIMLIKLKAPVYLNSYVSVAPLPRQGAAMPEGSVCRVSGWGSTSPSGGQLPSTLRTARLPIVSVARCNSSSSFDGNITDNMICAGYSTGGKDACKGDSGGPLVCDGRVYGIVSWGEGCADPRYPGVYTAVSRFRRWIDENIFSYYSQCRKY